MKYKKIEIADNVKNLIEFESHYYAASYFKWKMEKDFYKFYIESPIEQMFYVTWQSLSQFGSFIGDKKIFKGDYVLKLIPQFKVEQYRADFFVNGTSYLIELDGHIWHEKSPEQVRRDKEGERFFIRNGYKVLRFSGREVVENSFKCVYETYTDILKDIKNPKNIRDKK